MSDRLAALAADDQESAGSHTPLRARRSHTDPAPGPGGLGSIPAHASQDSGLASCAYPLSTQDVPSTDYPKIRAQFAGSRWPDLRTAGTAYVDLAMQLPAARFTDGYQTVWFYQRLSAACAKHRR
jgi:hypothetical protein